ncbi:Altered inheritance of mitochondria protein [Aspergillus mulundensis]|uniref:Altered inheritance of mitochondria protein n=1 Tax=Aspergillus mulundensis TaxID=1810919 RepID=A0A3D8QA62_9EURO|nr:Altered inheritance of mitochondria protein [Aspergillus mulundensis]RDW58557.1 Altered inheritance of mitochondria protein [Aspergillus mulundensis]
MVTFPQRLAIARSASHIPYFRDPWICSKQSAVTVPTRHHLSTSPPALPDEFFRNTSRRWIFNETDRLKERFVKFRPTELQRIAGEAVQQDYCPDMSKFAEGGFNRVFLLRAKNGREVIARIPTPIAGPSHYTTASEVATMDFLRTVLKLPVPKVLGYSATSDNPVGAEYILMERVEGESLSSRWLSLTTDEVKDITTQIANMEKRIFNFHFPAYGSLYYKKDLNGEAQVSTMDDFVIGPVSARQFWHGERSKTEIDRGPWLSSVDAVTAAARREMAVIQHHAKAQPRQTFLLPTNYDIHPSEHSSLLSRFLQLAPHLIQPGSSSAPTLRHPDLSLGNILLAPGTTKIISIIDWQDAVIFPRFIQAGYPAFCEHDSSRPQSLKIPSLPDHFDEMGLDEQRQSKAIFRLEEANLYYTAATGVHNDQHMDDLRLPHLGMLQYLLRQTGYPWDADVINLRAALVGTTTPSVWSKITSAVCPVQFSDEEREAAIAESQEWNESEQLLSRVREHLNIDLEGGTEPDNFERAVQGNRQFRMEMVRQAEAGQQEICWRNWPYKDKEDDSLPPQT